MILIILTVGLAVVIFGYYSAYSSYTYSSIASFHTAELYTKETEILTSPVVISYVYPTQPKQQLNYTVNFLLTVNIPSYEGEIYLIPFLMNASYDPYIYIPSAVYNGFINQVNNPSEVGYVNASLVGGQALQPQIFQNYVYLLNQQRYVSAYAFEVGNGETVNFTFISEPGLIPVVWVVVNIQGNYFRIAYPYVHPDYFINTEIGTIETKSTSQSTINGSAGWFSVLPQNNSFTIINVTLYNASGLTTYILANYEPINDSQFNISFYIVNSSGQYLIDYSILPYYSTLFYNVSVYHLTSSEAYVSISLYNVNGVLIFTKTVTTLVPNNYVMFLSASNDPMYQSLLYSLSSSSVSSLTNEMLYGGPYTKLNIKSNQYLEYFYLIMPPGSYSTIYPVGSSQTSLYYEVVTSSVSYNQ